MPRSLQAQQHPLAILDHQRQLLEPGERFPRFADRLSQAGVAPLASVEPTVLQLNLGKRCNQTCRHCHVDAGPDRTEVMSRDTLQACLDVLARTGIATVDLTGGAPEMNPDFRWLVAQVRALGRRVIDRCNLTILTVGAYRDLPEFLAGHQVEIVASLPYFLARNTDAQRGEGVFEASLTALHRLNALGYGREGSGLTLNLVYNPTGAFLAPRQGTVEPEYRRELRRRYGVEFNALYVLNNMPVNRYLEYLLDSGQYEAYLQRLVDAFNPQTVLGLMCRNTLSVSWDGRLYDCDFNQMLDLPPAPGWPRTIHDLEAERLADRPITTALHCFGCTAGLGSSCGGSLVS